MRCSRGLSGKVWGATAVALGIGVVSWPTAVSGQERAFVLRDGRRISLVKADNELAITFDRDESVEQAARELAASGLGIVEDAPGTPYARHRILRVTDTKAQRHSKILANPSVQDLRPVYYLASGNGPFLSTGAITVKVDPALTEAERQALWNDYRVEVESEFPTLADVYVVEVLENDEDEVLRAEAMAADSRIVWAQPDFRRRAESHQITVLDTYFDRQWHLRNTGQGGGTAGADIGALDAWLFAQGSGVLIGMFDDACDVNHEDMFEAYIGRGQDILLQSNEEGADDPRPKIPTDRHGTAVMGLAIARANTRGVRGVSFLSRFTASRGLSEDPRSSAIALAYTFARQEGVDVHINSWGVELGDPIPAILEDAVDTAFEQGRDLDGEDGPDPPLGMVVVFSAGNDGVELQSGDSLSTLPSVIGVGATDNQDRFADYSNFGVDIDVVAPGGSDMFAIATTDIDDALNLLAKGYNVGGRSDSGVDIDPNGRYTGTFSGTSVSCPIVAGIAALCLSANPLLTATDVRLILEHTADRVHPSEADYGNVTSRSLTYGQGRVNAARAVQAAIGAQPTAIGQTWPDRVADARLDGTQLKWKAAAGTREFMVIQSAGSFVFNNDDELNRFPQDGVCYSQQQIGCSSVAPESLGELPQGVVLTDIVTCTGQCSAGAEFTMDGITPGGTVAYAVYGRSSIGRYSWGVVAELAAAGGDGEEPTNVTGPKVTIDARPVEGTSPLTVRFSGNAQRTFFDIDDSRTFWDFDIDDEVSVNATTRTASYTYNVAGNEERTFIARLTMYDVEGNPGLSQVTIRVRGSGGTSGSGSGGGQASARLIIGIPGSPDSDVTQGVSPFDVLLSVDASGISGTLQSVRWDLGDGTTANSLVVPHTYINETDASLRLPISADVTFRTSSTTTQTVTATRVLTVLPGTGQVDQPDPSLPGTGAQPGTGGGGGTCGMAGMVPLGLMFAGLITWRRRSS